MENIYYVYMYLRKIHNTPYYVGKGKNNRAFEKHGRIVVPKDSTKIHIIKENLSNEEANELEKALIAQYGRKDNNTGILRNLTDGGEGTSGIIPWNKGKNHSEESKMKMSISRLANSKRGYNQSEEHIQKRANGKSKDYIITDPQGNIHHIRNLKKYCRDNGLNAGNMVRVLNGTRNHHKNYTISRSE